MDLPHVSGADLLVHGSNLILLFAYTRKDMLSLRVLALAAAVSIVPYYVLQPRILWPPILWSLVYAVVHGYHIVTLILERRPVELTPDEAELRKMSFPTLEPNEFKKLIGSCSWREAPTGTRFPASETTVLLLFSGRVEATFRGELVGNLGPGNLIGIAFQIEDVPRELSLVSSSSVRIASWPREQLTSEMEKSPPVRAAVTALVNHDLASKVIRLATAGSGGGIP